MEQLNNILLSNTAYIVANYRHFVNSYSENCGYIKIVKKLLLKPK